MAGERMIVSNSDFFRWVEDELRASGIVRIRVRGMSMYPLLRDGVDEVTLCRCVDDRSLHAGQIVLFRYGGGYVLHRILRREGERLLIRGDNVFGRCEECGTVDVAGMVTAVHRRRGGLCCSAAFADISPVSPRWLLKIHLRRTLLHLRHTLGKALRRT